MDRTMVRRNDHDTSIEAAKRVSAVRLKLHRQVLDAFKRLGPLTDGELENLPEFRGYGPSTIRKRRSELYQWGDLVPNGKRAGTSRCPMTIWKLKETELKQAELFNG